jgi:transposase
MDQAKSIIKLLHAQIAVPEICAKLKVPRSTIYYIKKKFELTGEIGQIPVQGRKKTAQMAANVTKIKDKLKNHPLMSVNCSKCCKRDSL